MHAWTSVNYSYLILPKKWFQEKREFSLHIMCMCNKEKNISKNQPLGVFVIGELPALVLSFARVTLLPHSHFFQETLETRLKMETAKVVNSPHRSRPACRSKSGWWASPAALGASHPHQELGWTSSWSPEPFQRPAGSLWIERRSKRESQKAGNLQRNIVPRVFNLLAIFMSFPNMAVLLASDCRCKKSNVNMRQVF